jgi:hypothetical protein
MSMVGKTRVFELLRIRSFLRPAATLVTTEPFSASGCKGNSYGNPTEYAYQVGKMEAPDR